MRLLLCSDGTPAAESATRLTATIARDLGAAATLLGIAEEAQDEAALRNSLEDDAQRLSEAGAQPRVLIKSGEPISQILAEVSANHYDMVIIGTRHAGSSGLFWRSARTYEIVKAVDPPVLVAFGECSRVKHFIVCTGGKHYIDAAIRLTGQLAAALHGDVTLLHVLAEPPAIFADLVRQEEDVDALLRSGSELGKALSAQKQALEKLGVPVKLRVRHGLVADQVFEEVREGDYDLIVSGSSRARGPLRHYIMGDLTRTILNRAQCPVLVARSELVTRRVSFWDKIRAQWNG
ncbi:MAG: universal stress protein [Verrucomicrobiota bacterium]